jgi:hypothetical protein
MDRYGLSSAAADERLQREAHFEQIVDELARQYPDVWGGAWVANTRSGTVSIAVTDPSAAAEITASLQNEPGTEVMTRPVGMKTLLDAYHQLEQSLEDAATSAGVTAQHIDEIYDASASVPEATLSVKVTDAQTQDIDPQTAARARNAVLAAAASFANSNQAGLPVDIATTDQQLGIRRESCDTIFSCTPLQGGTDTKNNGLTEECTLGFNAFRPATGAYKTLTAGHCGVDYWRHAGIGIGDSYAVFLTGGEDVQDISITSPSSWKPSNVIYRNISIPSKITSPGSGLLGITICHVGVGLALFAGLPFGPISCGYVSAIYSGGFGRVAGGAISCAGDSGGPWFNPDTRRAYGTHVGSFSGSGTCGSDDKAFQWTSDLESLLGVSILTSPVSW